MTHPKLIFKRMQFPTIHIHTPRSKNALTRSYEFGHYRSFLKVNKNTFFAKAFNLSTEYQNEIIPKGLVKGHIKLSKKSKNTSKDLKLRKLCIVEVGLFAKLPKVNYPQNFKFCQMAHYFSLVLSLHYCPRALALAMCPYLIFII